MHVKTKEIRKSGGFHRRYCTDKPCIKQTTYLLIVFACLLVTAGAAETYPYISFIGVVGMAWAVWKGQLWEVKEEGSENIDDCSGK